MLSATILYDTLSGDDFPCIWTLQLTSQSEEQCTVLTSFLQVMLMEQVWTKQISHPQLGLNPGPPASEPSTLTTASCSLHAHITVTQLKISYYFFFPN